ncbi:hypothetical protein LBBP_02542 [Leptospira borgpetersenii serovar Ballum]|uniref:Uncharacterized protein n=1 Tax=Leptospira borgpetersenii serovar Ballum TaxID=280505 RepID=A0A0S2ITE4_LEPBO|nr:hypothetical protein LBBP_02542 [Leptospira borgpetersenii serovar Ballum]
MNLGNYFNRLLENKEYRSTEIDFANIKSILCFETRDDREITV